jgi:hypothetical protein
LQRPAEITFYDELGVAPNASSEEVRDAFRALVRILHPDHQTDPQLKDIAERQMRKLNRIYGVLSDPEKRRRYQESLEMQQIGRAVILSPKSPVNAGHLGERVAWMAALGVVVGALVWLAWDNPTAGPTVSPPQVSERAPRKGSVAVAPAASDSGQEVARLRSELRMVEMERDLAVRELTRLQTPVPKPQSTYVPAEPVQAAALPVAAPALEAPSPVPAASPAVISHSSRVSSQAVSRTELRPFAGFWFYTKEIGSQRDRMSALYPPEFIETTIT